MTQQPDDANSDYLDVAHDSANLMASVACGLESIAKQLCYLGSPESPASSNLRTWAFRLRSQEELLRDSVGRKVSLDCRQAREMSTTLFQAVLAGIIRTTNDDAVKETATEMLQSVNQDQGEKT